MYYLSECKLWLDEIECEIEKKYQIPSDLIQFTHNFKLFKEKDSVLLWIGKILNEDRFIKYKRIYNNLFELKDFHPDPSTDLCLKLAKETITFFENEWRKTHATQEFFFMLGCNSGIVYNRNEILNVLASEIRNDKYSEVGYACMGTHPDPNPNKKRIILALALNVDEFFRDIEKGFIQLENKY